MYDYDRRKTAAVVSSLRIMARDYDGVVVQNDSAAFTVVFKARAKASRFARDTNMEYPGLDTQTGSWSSVTIAKKDLARFE